MITDVRFSTDRGRSLVWIDGVLVYYGTDHDQACEIVNKANAKMGIASREKRELPDAPNHPQGPQIKHEIS